MSQESASPKFISGDQVRVVCASTFKDRIGVINRCLGWLRNAHTGESAYQYYVDLDDDMPPIPQRYWEEELRAYVSPKQNFP